MRCGSRAKNGTRCQNGRIVSVAIAVFFMVLILAAPLAAQPKGDPKNNGGGRDNPNRATPAANQNQGTPESDSQNNPGKGAEISEEKANEHASMAEKREDNTGDQQRGDVEDTQSQIESENCTDESLEENTPVENEPVEENTDDPPVEVPPVEENADENQPPENNLNRNLSENQPPENETVEGSPVVENAPAEENYTDNQIEEAPGENTPVENEPVEENSIEEEPVEEETVEEEQEVQTIVTNPNSTYESDTTTEQTNESVSDTDSAAKEENHPETQSQENENTNAVAVIRSVARAETPTQEPPLGVQSQGPSNEEIPLAYTQPTANILTTIGGVIGFFIFTGFFGGGFIRPKLVHPFTSLKNLGPASLLKVRGVSRNVKPIPIDSYPQKPKRPDIKEELEILKSVLKRLPRGELNE